jgi:hypothetical protein
MTTEDPRIVLGTGGMNDPIVDHPDQPADYIHPFPDGPVWTRHQEWRTVGGVRLRAYELVTSIMLRGAQIGLADDPIVDHPRQPADYTHTDGTIWTWRKRWRLVGGVRDDKGFFHFRTHLRMYDLVTSGNGD